MQNITISTTKCLQLPKLARIIKQMHRNKLANIKHYNYNYNKFESPQKDAQQQNRDNAIYNIEIIQPDAKPENQSNEEHII